MAFENDRELRNDGSGHSSEDSHLEGDLEQYGVWVKVAPEDVDEAESGAPRSDAAVPDASSEDSSESEGDTDLTDDEERLLAPLESGDADSGLELPDAEEVTDAGPSAEYQANEEDESLSIDDLDSGLDELEFDEPDSSEDAPSLELEEDTFTIDTSDQAESTEEGSRESSADEEEEVLGLDIDEDFDEDILSLDTEESEEDDLGIDLEEPETLDPESASAAASEQTEGAATPEAESAASPEQPEITASFQGIAGPEEAAAPSSTASDSSEDESDTGDELAFGGLGVDEEELESIPGDEAPSDASFEDELEEPEEDLPELEVDEQEEAELTPVSEPETEEPASSSYDGDELERSLGEGGNEEGDQGFSELSMDLEEEPFDDLSAVQEEFSAPSEAGTAAAEGSRTQGSDESGAVLSSIEQELSSIKTELNDLRQELAALRSREPAGEADTSAASHTESEAEDESAEMGPGFFEEDEDETIALTGDELDNILNTAEFTERAGEPTQFEEEFGIEAESGHSEETSPSGTGEEPAEGESLLSEAEDIIPMESETEGEQESGSEADTGLETDAGIELEELTEQDESSSSETDDEQPFGGSDAEVDALAELDIDSELAGIDELNDEPASTEGYQASDEDDALASLDLDFPEPEEATEEAVQTGAEEAGADASGSESVPDDMRSEIRSVLSYMDQLLESLPEEKIQEFANSEYFETYRRLFEELGLER